MTENNNKDKGDEMTPNEISEALCTKMSDIKSSLEDVGKRLDAEIALRKAVYEGIALVLTREYDKQQIME